MAMNTDLESGVLPMLTLSAFAVSEMGGAVSPFLCCPTKLPSDYKWMWHLQKRFSCLSLAQRCYELTVCYHGSVTCNSTRGT